MNRRTLLRSFLGAAVASCVRWLPMPAVAEPEEVEDVPKLWIGDSYEGCGPNCGMHRRGSPRGVLHCGICGDGRVVPMPVDAEWDSLGKRMSRDFDAMFAKSPLESWEVPGFTLEKLDEAIEAVDIHCAETGLSSTGYRIIKGNP